MITVLSDEETGMEEKQPAQAHKAKRRGRWGRNLVLSDPKPLLFPWLWQGEGTWPMSGHARKETQLS